MAGEADERGRPLASFVAELELLVGRPDKLEVELPRESARGVRIMTVHKSKGLEFPVVIIPQANNVGQDRSSRDAWYWEEALGPTFRPPAGTGKKSRNAFFEASKERRTAMDRAELKRLLYVALTRAESHIVVTATEPRSVDTKGKSFRGLLSGALGLLDSPSPLAPSDGAPSPLAPSDGEPGATVTEATVAIVSLAPFGKLASLPSGALVGAIPERSDFEYFALVSGSRGKKPPAIDFSSIPRVEGRKAEQPSVPITVLAAAYEERNPPDAARAPKLAEDPLLSRPEGIESDAWGSLVHAELEAALGQGPGASRSLEAILGRLEDRLASASAAESAASRAKALAAVFLGSELGKRALAARERRVELKIAIALESDASPGASPRSPRPRYARGSIDLAFVEGGKVVIVDYKTDAVMAEDAHELQVAAYERAAADIFGLPAEAWIFYLYGGGRAVRVDADGRSPRLEEALSLPDRSL
jgi:ATP-dependent exoDNAse (exonuclease V) beta subunit